MFAKKRRATQPEFWIATDQVVMTAETGFYAKLEETWESFDFAAKVRALCQPACDKNGVGRPGIDPVVYLKMIMVFAFSGICPANGRSRRAVPVPCRFGPS
jgi:hypothetical protein